MQPRQYYPTVQGSLGTHVVFDTITSPTQYVVFEIQQLEASVNVLDELADLKRT